MRGDAAARAFWWTILAVAVIKFAVLQAFHPIETPDTGGYDAVASAIAKGTWFHPDLASGPAPMTVFRMPGYPLFLMACDALAGPYGRWLVVVVQYVLSLAVSVAVFRLARRAGLGPGLSAAVLAATALSLPLLLDIALLTDSINASLLCLVLCLLGSRVLERKPLSPGVALLCGVLLCVCFLLREATMVFSLFMVPLVLAAGWPLTRRRVAVVALIFLPLVVVYQGYKEINRFRVGAAITTTGAQTTLVYALAKASRHDMAVFDGDTALDRAARKVLRGKDFDEVQLILNETFTAEGRGAVDQLNEAYAVYFRAWRRHPLAMVRVPLDHLRANQAQLILRPVESLREIMLWAWTDDRGFARWHSVRAGQWWNVPLIIVDAVCKALSIVVFTSFLLLTPWRAWRERLGTPMAQAGLGVWLFYFGLFATYAMVHLETRYLVGAVPASAVVGLANLLWLWRLRRVQAAGKPGCTA